MRIPALIFVALLIPSAAVGAPQSASVIPLRVSGGKPHFTAIAPAASGVTFTNLLAQQRHLTNQILLNGSGVTAGDVDGDGLADLYFCGLDGPNALYRNLGNWRFQDITAEAGVACAELDASGTAFADLDGDRDLDLLVSSVGGGTHLLQNDGKGRFTRLSEPLNRDRGGTSLALTDLDGNGTLDVYVANYRTVTLRDQPNTSFKLRMVDGKPTVSTINGRPLTDPDLTNRFTFQIKLDNGRASFASDEHGEPDGIFLNDGRSQFTQVDSAGGIFLDEEGLPLGPMFDWGLSVMIRDLNADGAPDIYVCNDFKSPDRVWMNDGKGRFHALPRSAIRQTSLSSMGVDVADINRDGHFDIFVVDMLSRDHSRRLTQRPDVGPEPQTIGDTTNRVQSARNTMLLARGDGTFAEIAQLSGLEAAEWAWTPIFLDVDLDGFEDVLISNGFERDGMNVDVLREIELRKSAQKLPSAEQLGLRRIFPRLDTPNAAFRNLGNLRFADVSAEWGFDARGVSQGMALADLDNDGDLDVMINNLNGAAMLYRNDTGAPRVAVRLEGMTPNTRGVGAKIAVTGGPVAQSQEMICGGRYLSSDDFIRVFAAGSMTNKLRIEVTWRNGRHTVVDDVRPNHLYTVNEIAAMGPVRSNQEPAAAMFQDASASLGHRHTDAAYDDSARQPLLPKKLSEHGSGVSWFDLDGDGWDDLIIASGGQKQPSVFVNERNGTFKETSEALLGQTMARDHGSILGWRRSSNEVALLAGLSNYRESTPGTAMVRQILFPSKRAVNISAGHGATLGSMAMADVDGDDDLDLFVAGRVLPGRYPEPPSSTLFRNEHGTLAFDAENTKAFAKVGLVSGAVFSDIDSDGDPDLLLACEWGPVRAFKNDSARFKEITRELGLDKYRGWWNGVATGDFDSDGRLDIVASNWGENTKYERFRSRSLRIYFGDFENDGIGEIIEAHYEPSLKSYVPSRNLDAMLVGMPWLRSGFPIWASFSTATVEQVLRGRIASVNMVEANWLATTVFLNRGGSFEAMRLPDEAQFSPAFAICVADFDGDGNEDIFLSQNFFATAPDTSRYDAGRGLLVRGDGKGGFRPLTGRESGIVVYGEQRGAAVSDFDHDGRVDIVVTQNGTDTKLYRNVTAKPGVRVRLSGPGGNPHGIGAILRVGGSGKYGAAREIHAGAGYRSQDSAVSVFAPTGNQIMVRWPGGKTTASAIPGGAKEIEIHDSGTVKVLR